jgi:hypothetical protein
MLLPATLFHFGINAGNAMAMPIGTIFTLIVLPSVYILLGKEYTGQK